MAKVTGGDKAKKTLANIRRAVKTATQVEVGFMEDAVYPDGKKVALIAAFNEFGVPSRGQPPRPFFRDMIAEKSPAWPEAIARLLKRNNYDADKTLNQVGALVAGQLKQSIYNFDRVLLADSTIARKGFDKQLIRTQLMVNSVTFRVVK